MRFVSFLHLFHLRREEKKLLRERVDQKFQIIPNVCLAMNDNEVAYRRFAILFISSSKKKKKKKSKWKSLLIMSIHTYFERSKEQESEIVCDGKRHLIVERRNIQLDVMCMSNNRRRCFFFVFFLSLLPCWWPYLNVSIVTINIDVL